MKVSIIVPIYNTYQYLDKCIGSLVSQTTKEPYEIILVNDCSPDKSLEKMYEYRIKYPALIRVIDSKVNVCLGGARNLGINAANGEFLLFVDSDDYIAENTLELLIDNAFDYDIICSNKSISWKGDSFITGIGDVNFNSYNIDILLRKELVVCNSISVWNMLYRKEFLNDYNLRFVEHLFYEDAYFIFQVMINAKSIKTINEPFYFYRENNFESISKKLNNERHWEAEITAKLLLEYGKNHKDYLALKEEIDYNYISRCVIIYYTYSIKKFYPPRFDKVKQGTHILKEMFPRYEKCKYYKRQYTFKQRISFKIASCSPKIYYKLNKIMGRI